ncbi:sorbitol dehydrogenase [Patella vulgata]|uniref:sorbitol dehydrogenase n=1 Tax=Patella vulgata TaxID=6465 RepID=UPI0024A95081|nr:sorbitol dehydrogenase [Patella vulgata]XP_050393206.2 sorbitol dehydrogenase [Patella vulgata]
MTDTNLSAILYKTGDLRLEDRPIPEPGRGEVQISMQKMGICGSDVKYWQKGAIGHFIVVAPMLLGHECAGIVSKLGEGVINLKVGDRVAIEPGVPCRQCEWCKSGRYNLCPDVFFLATPPDSGALARYHVHAADFCFKLPDNVSFEEGALIEPLSVGLHACQRAGVNLGSKVLVCGAGPIGLSAMLSAKAMGAASICMTDIDDRRLEFARSLGATKTVKVESTDPEEVSRQVKSALGGWADQAIECSGAQFSVELGIQSTKPGGAFAVVGHGPDNVTIPITTAIAREVEIRGSFRYVNTWPAAIAMIASGKINIKPMITHRFTIEETLQAFETAKSGAGVKIMISCHK